MRYPLIGGSYVARSKIANAQRCINYFPEINREDSPTPFTYYQRPGLRRVAQGPTRPVRAIYRASNGQSYTVIGQNVYQIGTDWALTLLGTLTTNLDTQVKMSDNGIQILLVDNSQYGYIIDLTSGTFSRIVDPSGLFHGATTAAYLDTFIVWNQPGTRFFGSTLSNQILPMDPLYFAGKSGYPDKLVAVNVNRHELFLLGEYKSEIWYNAGNPAFPFAILPGAYVEHGLIAPYSVATIDIETMWLGQDLQGKGVVFSLKGYDTSRISNHALEDAISKMEDISDAIAYTYQQGGHYFYVLTFPSGNQTWVYDSSLARDINLAWHQRGWTDANGDLHRERVNCAAYVNGEILGGDYETGSLYVLDLDHYTDDVSGVPGPISYVKGFPHLFQAPDAKGGLVPSDNKRIQFNQFTLDMECGDAPLGIDGRPALVGLRTSRTRGFSWDTTILQSAGAPGQYETAPNWAPNGVARDMVFEIQHSIAGPAALQGCWVQATLLTS